jgi:hypothetical protein
MTTAPTIPTVPLIRESQIIIRERSFPISQEIIIFVNAIQHRLGLTRSTGMLCVDLNQGGAGTIRFQERQEIKNND